jgi:hypothetical protein
MRLQLAVLACLCLLLAGCGAVPSESGSTVTVNPALAETPTALPTPDPPSTTAVDDSVDARALADAHERALGNRSVTVTVTSRTTYENWTVRLDSVQQSFAAGDEQLYRLVTTETPYRRVNALTFNVSHWRNDTVSVERREYQNGSAVVTVVDGGSPVGRSLDFDPTGARVLAAVLGEYAIEEDRVVVAGGEPLRRVVEANAEQPNRPFRSNVRVEALVTAEGVVRSASVTYRTARFRAPATVRTTVTVTAIGNTSVPRPRWVNETLAGDR